MKTMEEELEIIKKSHPLRENAPGFQELQRQFTELKSIEILSLPTSPIVKDKSTDHDSILKDNTLLLQNTKEIIDSTKDLNDSLKKARKLYKDINNHSRNFSKTYGFTTRLLQSIKTLLQIPNSIGKPTLKSLKGEVKSLSQNNQEDLKSLLTHINHTFNFVETERVKQFNDIAAQQRIRTADRSLSVPTQKERDQMTDESNEVNKNSLEWLSKFRTQYDGVQLLNNVLNYAMVRF